MSKYSQNTLRPSDRSKMTLEELELEDYHRQRERRRLNLINPNRKITWQELRENGELNEHLVLSGLFYGTLLVASTLLLFEMFSPPYYGDDDDYYF